MRTSEVAAATRGCLAGPDVVVSGAAIDSRLVRPGQLFVPIVAGRDGHDFVGAALAAGAAAFLTARPRDEVLALHGDVAAGGAEVTAVEVGDTAAALTALGAAARDLLSPTVEGRVVGITGSVGKTSVKDLLAAALRTRWRTQASVASFNNDLGVPLTLLDAENGTEAAVVEMGARGPGHVAALCAVARPSIGIVTRVAAVHTQTFGTIEAVAEGKGELVEALPADGTAVLNAGDPRVAAMAGRASAAVLTFGDGGDVRAERVAVGDDLCASFLLVTPLGAAEVRLAARGRHMVENALAAAAGALACAVPLDGVVAGLEAASLSSWRMELSVTRGGTRVLNDAYNANPTSMAAALRSLAGMQARRRVAVLGLMAELGETSDDDHAAVGELARSLGIEVVAVGVAAYGGTLVPDVDAAATLLGDLGPNDAVLLKASRVVGLERLAARLR